MGFDCRHFSKDEVQSRHEGDLPSRGCQSSDRKGNHDLYSKV